MTNDNARTLQSYQNKTQEYVAGTPPIDDAIKAWQLDLLKDDIGAGYNMILADAVLLHFTPEKVAMVSKKITTLSRSMASSPYA